MTELVAPKDWNQAGGYRWFDSVPESVRRAFVEKYCTKTFRVYGQTCMVISYPRQDGTVRVFDLDSGAIYHVTPDNIAAKEKGREVEEADYGWSGVMTDDACCEAEDISILRDFE